MADKIDVDGIELTEVKPKLILTEKKISPLSVAWNMVKLWWNNRVVTKNYLFDQIDSMFFMSDAEFEEFAKRNKTIMGKMAWSKQLSQEDILQRERDLYAMQLSMAAEIPKVPNISDDVQQFPLPSTQTMVDALVEDYRKGLSFKSKEFLGTQYSELMKRGKRIRETSDGVIIAEFEHLDFEGKNIASQIKEKGAKHATQL